MPGPRRALYTSAVVAALISPGCGAGAAADGCGTGTWHRGVLEIHHLDVGQADSTLIVGPTGRTVLVDAGETDWDLTTGAQRIGSYVKGVLGCARLDYVLITHFHLDHIGYVGKGGLWHLVNVQGFEVGQTLHRDFRAYLGDAAGTLRGWRSYLDGDGRKQLNPAVAGLDTRLDLGPGVSLRIIASDGAGLLRTGNFSRDAAPPNENDYSVALRLRFGQFDYFLGGDLSGEFASSDYGYAYHDVETHVARLVGDVDVYRANHHGSDHSSNATFVAQLAPRVSIISVGDGNPFGHPRQATLDRLSAAGAVYLTERGDLKTRLRGARVAGHVVVRSSDGVSYTVNGDPYVARDPSRVDADGDGYFREADPDDAASAVVPAPRGGCDPMYQPCTRP